MPLTVNDALPGTLGFPTNPCLTLNNLTSNAAVPQQGFDFRLSATEGNE
jgi:hypothetical protein